MEVIWQTLAGMGPMKIIGLVLFVLLGIAAVRAACGKNNMPGDGDKGSTPTNTQPPQDKQDKQ